MEENQHLPEGENTEPPPKLVNTTDNAVPETEQEITHDLTETEDMEIHHHPHIHHKKKWHDYLFEFFMFFLAVSSGFFVENLREHYVEHQRAKEYAAMLRKDLAGDTTIINIIIHFRNEQKRNFDTLQSMIKTVPYEKINQKEFLQLAGSAGQYMHLIANNGTLGQLKSSGSLRYFTDTSLVYILTSYEEDLKHGEYIQGEEKQFCAEQMIPFKLHHFNNLYKDASVSLAAAQNFPETGLIDFDKKTMMEFCNLLDKCAWFNNILGNEGFSRYKKKASDICDMLQKEYGPE